MRINQPYAVTQETEVKLSLKLLWAICGACVTGSFIAASVWFKVSAMESKLNRLDAFERDIIRIKAHLGLAGDRVSADNFSAADNR